MSSRRVCEGGGVEGGVVTLPSKLRGSSLSLKLPEAEALSRRGEVAGPGESRSELEDRRLFRGEIRGRA